MAHSSRSLIAPQCLTRLLQPRRPTLRFLVFDAKGGEGLSMIDIGGVIYLGGAYLLHLDFYVWYLICIHVYFYALNYISVIVILMWSWLLCDIWHMCSLLWSLYMSYHLVMLIYFASVFYSDANELYFLYSCLFHICWVHHVGLGHISLPNSFVLIVKSLYEPSMLKTSCLLHTRCCIVINHQKEGDWNHLGP